MELQKTKPTRPGYYWVKGAYANLVIFELCEKNGKLFFTDEINHWTVGVDDDDCAYAGPIPEPENA